MAGASQGGSNMDQFEVYFRRADLDQDERISGAEAVGVLKRSNLPQPVLAQVRADRIQHDLEELLKALADRCKKHELNLKSTALIELLPGWQPGIPEISAVWDEDWDKFEDEGFSFDVAVPANSKSTSIQKESSPIHSESLILCQMLMPSQKTVLLKEIIILLRLI